MAKKENKKLHKRHDSAGTQNKEIHKTSYNQYNLFSLVYEIADGIKNKWNKQTAIEKIDALQIKLTKITYGTQKAKTFEMLKAHLLEIRKYYCSELQNFSLSLVIHKLESLADDILFPENSIKRFSLWQAIN